MINPQHASALLAALPLVRAHFIRDLHAHGCLNRRITGPKSADVKFVHSKEQNHSTRAVQTIAATASSQ
jgi:hypothetical protein